MLFFILLLIILSTLIQSLNLGKNIFYLPKNTPIDYTAIMTPANDDAKEKEKIQRDTNLILECIGTSRI